MMPYDVPLCSNFSLSPGETNFLDLDGDEIITTLDVAASLRSPFDYGTCSNGFSGSEQDTKAWRSQTQALVLIDSLRAEILKEVKEGKDLKESFMDFAFEYSNDPSAKQNRGFNWGLL